MPNIVSIASAGIVTGALLLSGCSSAGSAGPVDTVPQATYQNGSSIVDRYGLDRRYTGFAYRSIESRIAAGHTTAEKDLFVSDGGSTVFLFKNNSYKPAGTITNGLLNTDGVWVDKAGNLYVANVDGQNNVTEFAPGASTPTCTYTGANDPVGMTTDAKGNVFVLDFQNFGSTGYVDEYQQCQNTIVKKLSINKGPNGVAVDAKGDVFVSYFNASLHGAFEEFPNGSTTGTVLGATVGSPGGLVLDKKGNLIADDQTGSIDIIAPPYTTATPLVSGLTSPFHVGLNKKETRLFNANASSSPSVTIYSYPSGSLKKTLDSSDGLDGSLGVSDSPNAVF
ncbi:MAG TPA: hypothetical protein VGF18_08275 [Candidatus Tumulicola sp.]